MTFSISKMRFYFEVKVAFLLPLSWQDLTHFCWPFLHCLGLCSPNSFSMVGNHQNITRLQLLWSLKFQIYKWNFNLVNLESPTQTSSRIFLLILHLSLGPIEQPQWTTQSPWCILVTLVSNVRLKDDLLWFLALTGVHHYPLSLNLLPFPVLCLWIQDVSYCSNILSAKLLKLYCVCAEATWIILANPPTTVP